MSDRKLAVIGGGQMGRALVGGMLAKQVVAQECVQIVDPDPNCHQWWGQQYPKITASDDFSGAVAASDTVLLAVKPNILPQVCSQPSQTWSGKLILSIAAGVSLESLCGWIGHERVVRVMPNTPSLVGEGASAFCVAGDVDAADQDAIEAMLSSVGIALKVDDKQMDAVTGLSGSGPAYVCMVIEALADGGVLAGLPRPIAMQLATQTVLGTAKMVAETGQHPGQLKDAVASPGGTTIAAISELEQNGLRGALIRAVAASANRSKELG